MTEIAAGNPRFRRMYRLVSMISAEEISLPKDRRCLRFKCNSFYELNAVNTLPVHDLSAVNDCILRFKYSSTHVNLYAAYTFLDIGDRVDLQGLVNLLEAARGGCAAAPD